MHIGIDCRLSGISHAGIGRYIENLISRLPILAPEIKWVYFYRTPDQILPSLKKQPNVSWVHTPIQHYSLQEQLQLPSIFHQEKLDLLHVPHFNVPINYNGKLIVTIHDLLWHEQRGTKVTTLKSWKYWVKYLGYKIVTAQAIKKAQQILVPTQTIKETLFNYYPDAASKISITYEGVDDRLLKFKDQKVTRKTKSLIYVGSLYPHKNINLVLKALQQLSDWKLTIVGSRNVFQEQIKKETQKLGVEKQVEFTGYLADETLAQKIKETTALIQPSLSEGFGLTGVEALALGTPIITSNIPVFKEIYQDAAVYFDPQSESSFVKALTKEKPTKNQMKRVVSNYSWNKMAKQTLASYKAILN